MKASVSPPPLTSLRHGPAAERWIERAAALAVTVVVLAPFLWTPGFALIGDMVFVPDQPWKDAWTGGDGGVPRAVPADAVVSVLSTVLGGELVQRLVLALPLVAGFLGMTRLLAAVPLTARIAGGLCFVWSPYVLERLAIGHWGLLCGYAALPWVVWATLRLRDESAKGRGRALAVLTAALFAAAWGSPTGALLVVGAGLVMAWGSRRLVATLVGLGVLVNLPWLMPAFLNGADAVAPDVFGVEAFAAAADTPWGMWGSLFTFGGIWKTTVMPGVREEWLFAVVALTVAVVAVVGLSRGHRDGPGGRVLPRGRAFLLAGAGLVVAGAGAGEFTRPVVEWLIVHVPGAGLLRDGQKWVAWWSLPAAVGFACATTRVMTTTSRWAGERSSGWQAGLCLALLPVLALPTLALGAAGVLRSVEYPDDWSVVRAEMDRRGAGDDRVVALPFSTYRQFGWNARAVLDPVSRFFPGATVTEDALTVEGGTVGGESPVAARVRSAQTPGEMADVMEDVGVTWVLAHRSGTVAVIPEGARLVVDTDELDLWEVAGSSAVEPVAGRWRAPVYVAVDLAVLTLSLIVVIRGLTSENSSH